MDAVAGIPKPPLAVPRRLLRLRSDAALAERFAAGDDAAFAVLYERHRPSVIAVCMGVLGSTHDAEDAAQDAFAALAVSLRQQAPRELRAWLARVARNAAIDVARRRRRGITADGEIPDVAAGTGGAKAELESVMAGIRELPESQRTALLMRELAGHSYAEIAALLELDEEAVRGLIARARVGLRTHREASELPCATARAALAAEPQGTKVDRTIRRHTRGCAPCRAYRQALRDDARALRGIMPGPASGVAGGGVIFGGLAAKGALVGGAVTQLTAACAVSVCAVGSVVLLYPHPVRRAAGANARAGASRLPAAGRPQAAGVTGGPASTSSSFPGAGRHGGAQPTGRQLARAGTSAATPSAFSAGARTRSGAAATGTGGRSGAGTSAKTGAPSRAPTGHAGQPAGGPSAGATPPRGGPGSQPGVRAPSSWGPGGTFASTAGRANTQPGGSGGLLYAAPRAGGSGGPSGLGSGGSTATFGATRAGAGSQPSSWYGASLGGSGTSPSGYQGGAGQAAGTGSVS